MPMTMPSRPADDQVELHRQVREREHRDAGDVIAASTDGVSRNSGATSAMKHSGTANSSDHADGIRLPAKKPAMHATCQVTHSATPRAQEMAARGRAVVVHVEAPDGRGEHLVGRAGTRARAANARGSGFRYGAIAALYIRRRRPSTVRGQHDDRERRVGRASSAR